MPSSVRRESSTNAVAAIVATGSLLVAGTAMGAIPSPWLLRAQQAPASQEVETFTLTSDRVSVYNLAGSMRIEGHDGSDVIVEIRRAGAEGAELTVDVDEIRGRESLRVMYPDGDIVYAGSPSEGRSSVRVRDDGTFGGDGDDWDWGDLVTSLFGAGDRVRISSSGDGTEAWADIRVLVPEGRDVDLNLAFGQANVSGVAAPLSVDVGTGSVRSTGTRGTLRLDIGSGSIDVRDAEGDVDLDTGSGSVTVGGVRGGDLRIDTGSGSVAVEGVTSGSVLVDTGSGSVRGERLTAGSINVDTGSGPVRLSAVSADDVRVDTGSGSVVMELTEDVDTLEIDTGSGSIQLRVPEDLGAQLEAETGSGGIETTVPIRVRSSERGDLDAVIGDGNGRIRLDTGSGEVRIEPL